MATAKALAPVVVDYTLTLSRNEALALVALSGSVGGFDAPGHPRRVICDALRELSRAMELGSVPWTRATKELGVEITRGVIIDKLEG